MWADDQDMRITKFDSKIDKRNQEKLKKIIKKYGWPTDKLVGPTARRTAWIVAQHADKDLPFQVECLKHLSKAVKKKEASPTDLAYLTDRVLVNLGKEQTYGTQFYENEKGKFGPRPIKDVKNLEKRRKKLGMEPFKEYKKQMLKIYNENKLKR